MNHNEIRHMLSEYIDGSLTPGEKTSVDEHLKTCPDCANALRELRKTVEHIKKIEAVEPPAWMTQKIMARVRAEEEKKKQGLLQRIFFPLHVKLPLETIGVLFIAVTLYFVVQDVQETKQRFPETAMETYSSEPPQVDKGMAKEDKAPKPADSLERTREAPREPGYKALDMKREYEKPQPPQPAPSPQASSRNMQDQAPAKEFSGLGEASQAPASAMAKKKAGTARAEISSGQMLTLVVSDLDHAAARVEDAVKEYGGKIIRKETADGALSLIVTVDAANRNRFIDRLKTLGELKGIDAAEIRREGTVIEIRIVKQAQQS